MEELLQRFDDWLRRQSAKDIMRFAALTIAAFFFLLALLAMLVSCKSAQVTERVVYRDSVQTLFVHDTLVKVERDSSGQRIEQAGDMLIEFAAGGGDFNVQTGQASNVQRVVANSSRIEQTSTTHESDSAASTTTMAMQAGEELTIDKEKKPKRTRWQRFSNAWTISTLCALIIGLALLIWRNWSKIAMWVMALFMKIRK